MSDTAVPRSTTLDGRPGQRRTLRSLVAWLGAMVLAISTCTDSTAPSSGTPGFSVVTGADQSDTALARLPLALLVVVRGADGHAAAGEIVRFESVPSDSPPHVASVLVARVTSADFGVLAVDTTQADGQATALLRLGTSAGPGRVALHAPRLGYRDTVNFTVLPGAPAHLAVAPADTAVYVAHTYALRAYVADVHGNRRSEQVLYRAIDSGVTVSAAGQVTGAVFGRSSVLISTAGLPVTDTARVSVVPQGTIASVASASGVFPANIIVTMNIDGSGVAVVPQSAGDNNYLQWAPGGSNLLFYRPRFGGHLYTITLSGTLSRLVQSAGFAEDGWGRYSADGNWVFFRGGRAEGGPGYVWRIRSDGTGLDSLHLGRATQPAPSPDGSRVAYVDSVGQLHVYDIGLAKDTALGFGGWAPHWSPDGAWIAFAEGSNGLLSTVRPDGTARRVLAAGGSFDWSFDWSADSQWLVAFDPVRASLFVVHVQTAVALPLPFTSGLIEPSWRP